MRYIRTDEHDDSAHYMKFWIANASMVRTASTDGDAQSWSKPLSR